MADVGGALLEAELASETNGHVCGTGLHEEQHADLKFGILY